MRYFTSMLTCGSLCAYVLLGCSGKIESYPTLANQGVLGLSSTDPTLGSNLFIAEESEKSPVLRRFLQSHGAPTAIAINDEDYSTPTVFLYYPEEKRTYIADLDTRNKRYDWIVRGPYAIDRKDYRGLSELQRSLHGKPVFIIDGKEQRFGESHKIEVADIVIPVVPTPRPVISHPPPKVVKKRGATVIRKAPAVEPTPIRPLNTDQQAIAMAKGFAERAENGDIFHTVKGSDENLSSISKWYTGSPGNGGEIGSLNQLSESTPLAPGTKVRVPLKLIREFKAMPAGYK